MGKEIQSNLLPIRANLYPFSSWVSVIPEYENSKEAFIRKMVSIRNPVAMELNNELNNMRNEANPYFRAKMLPDCEPKNGLLITR